MTPNIEARLKEIEDYIASVGISKLGAMVSTYIANWLCELVREQQKQMRVMREALVLIANTGIDSPSATAELEFLSHKTLEMRGIAKKALSPKQEDGDAKEG